MTRVAVLGTGALGSAIVRQLARSDVELIVWNRSRDRAEPLTEFGVRVAESPEEAAEGADVLLTTLADGPVVADNAARALSALAHDAIWIQVATVGLDPLDQLVRLAADNGVPFLDCPVSGSPEDAENGNLAVLASGPDDVLDRAMPVLQALARTVVRAGDTGSGTSLKLAINTWLNTMLEGAAEAVAFAEARGVDPTRIFDALKGGPLDSPWLQSVGRAMSSADYAGGGSISLALKDVRLARDAVEADGLDLPLPALLAQRLARAVAAGAEFQQQLVEVSRGDRRSRH